MSFFGALGLIFITLKLLGTITWSWWLVLLPLYGGAVIVFTLFFLSALFGVAKTR